MSKKKNRVNTFLNSLSVIVPILISIGSFYYTYTVDKKNSAERLEIQILDSEYDNLVLLINGSHHDRASIKKKMRIDLINNSNNGIVLDRIAERNNSKFNEGPEISCVGHSILKQKYIVRENEKFIIKKLPVRINSKDYTTIYSDFEFLLGKKATSFLKEGILKKKKKLSISQDSLNSILEKNNIPLFNNNNMESYNRELFEYEVISSTGNVFKTGFSYYPIYIHK